MCWLTTRTVLKMEMKFWKLRSKSPEVGSFRKWPRLPEPAAPADLQQQPTQFNTRGADSNSGQQRNNYLTSGLLDSYALERYEFGRGPNAALFNIGSGSTLAGGLGSQTKRPRYDRSVDTIGFTYGSWDYQRATLDVNRPLSNKVAVRGHTDSVAFANTENRNNWSLSAERAEATRQLVEKNGVKSNRFARIEGVADTAPYNPNDPLDARNRRISITVLYRD